MRITRVSPDVTVTLSNGDQITVEAVDHLMKYVKLETIPGIAVKEERVPCGACFNPETWELKRATCPKDCKGRKQVRLIKLQEGK